MNEFHNEGFLNNINIGGKNLFNSEKIISNVFIPNQIKLGSSSSDEHDNKIYNFTCKDDSINGINYFIVEIELNELRGKGLVAYQKNLAYQLINSFSIRSINNKKNDCFLIGQREIFNNVKNLGIDIFSKWSTQSGSTKELCNFTFSDCENGLLKPKVTLYARVKLPFDNATTEVLKFPKGSELFITLSLRSLNEALCYGSSYMTNLTPKDMYASVNLYAYCYNIMLGDHIPTYYIEHEENICIKPGILRNVSYNQEQQGRTFLAEKKLARSISSVKIIADAMLSGKRFLVYPGYDQSEKNWIKKFHEKLIEELIIEIDEYDDIDSYIKENYKTTPKSADNVNYNNPIFTPIDQVKNVEITILNIPKNKKLYYHTNILGYNYVYTNQNSKLKEIKVTNLSDKYIKIVGEYHNNKILYKDIVSTIDILDVSTPLDAWNSQNGFNNRSKYKELDYIIINDNFMTGLDFLGKNQPLEYLSFYIDQELSPDKEKRSLCGFKNAIIYLLNSINGYDKYPQEYFYKYSHNIMVVKPNIFKITKSIMTAFTFKEFYNQVNEYDINFILKLNCLKELKVKDGVILSEYI